MPINFSGSRIFTDNNTKNLVIKQGISGEAIELSANKVKVLNNNIYFYCDVNTKNILELNKKTVIYDLIILTLICLVFLLYGLESIP